MWLYTPVHIREGWATTDVGGYPPATHDDIIRETIRTHTYGAYAR